MHSVIIYAALPFANGCWYKPGRKRNNGVMLQISKRLFLNRCLCFAKKILAATNQKIRTMDKTALLQINPANVKANRKSAVYDANVALLFSTTVMLFV